MDKEFIFINQSYSELIPIECFLNRVFPIGFYGDQINEIVYKRAFKPRKDCDVIHLKTPINWEGDAFPNDRNWRMQLQGWAMFHPIMNIFDLFDDKECIVEYFFDVVDDWNNAHISSDEYTLTSRMPSSYAWYDMSVGFRALVLAFFINRINFYKIKLSKGNIELLQKVVVKHVNNLSFDKAFSLNNHGLFQIQGLMALVNLSNVDALDEKRNFAIEKMEALILSQFSLEGIHKEHSPHYHFYATDTAKSILKTNWYEQSEKLNGIVRAADKNKSWMVDPLKRPVCIGDSILTEQKTLVLPKGNKGNTIVGDFSSSGYAIVKSDWEEDIEQSHMLFMTGMYHTKSHKHRDCLSFELFNKGNRVLCDSGKYGYKSDKYRNYFLSHRAHNTVEIEGFDIIKIKPYGSCLNKVKLNDKGHYSLSGSLDYPAIKHHRNLSYMPNNWLLVEDSLNFVKARWITQWFHLGADFVLSKFKGNYFKFNNQKGDFVEIECLNTELEAVFSYGDEDSMQGFISEKDYKFNKAIAIGFTGHTSELNIKTIIKYGDRCGIDSIIHSENSIIQSESLKSSTPKSIFENIKHAFLRKPVYALQLGQSTMSRIVDNVPFNFFVDKKKSSSKLIVLLPGATNRSKGDIDLQRFSWSNEFDSHVVSFADPTISKENDLSIGWFQYKKGIDCISALAKLLTELTKNLNVLEKDLTFFGSSAGGFVALKLAELFPEAKSISINPQIYLDRYTKSHFDAMKLYSYDQSNVSEATFKERTKVNYKNIVSRKAATIIVQNEFDLKHYERHLKTFLSQLPIESYYQEQITNFDNLSSFDDLKGIQIFSYRDEELKHSPPNRSDTLCLLRSLKVK